MLVYAAAPCYVWATRLLEGVDLVLRLLAARTSPADTVRVGLATRTPLRWFALLLSSSPSARIHWKTDSWRT